LDDVTNVIIRNCRIYDMCGFNSDSVDIGEKAANILIDSLVVHNIIDKGLFVGQQSSASVNSLFVNCNLGIALKDYSYVTIDRSTFFGNN